MVACHVKERVNPILHCLKPRCKVSANTGNFRRRFNVPSAVPTDTCRCKYSIADRLK